MRADALQHKAQTNLKAYEESIRLGNEIATILRKNFVQAQRVASGTDERWSRWALLLVVALSDFLSRNPNHRTHRTWQKRLHQEPSPDVNSRKGQASEVSTNPSLVPFCA